MRAIFHELRSQGNSQKTLYAAGFSRQDAKARRIDEFPLFAFFAALREVFRILTVTE